MENTSSAIVKLPLILNAEWEHYESLELSLTLLPRLMFSLCVLNCAIICISLSMNIFSATLNSFIVQYHNLPYCIIINLHIIHSLVTLSSNPFLKIALLFLDKQRSRTFALHLFISYYLDHSNIINSSILFNKNHYFLK